MCVTFVFIFTQISDKLQKLLNSCSGDIPTTSEYYQRFPNMFPGFPKVAECSSAKHQILAPSCQDHAYLSEITKTRYRETLTYDLRLNKTFCAIHRTFLRGNWIQFLMEVVLYARDWRSQSAGIWDMHN